VVGVPLAPRAALAPLRTFLSAFGCVPYAVADERMEPPPVEPLDRGQLAVVAAVVDKVGEVVVSGPADGLVALARTQLPL